MVEKVVAHRLLRPVMCVILKNGSPSKTSFNAIMDRFVCFSRMNDNTINDDFFCSVNNKSHVKVSDG